MMANVPSRQKAFTLRDVKAQQSSAVHVVRKMPIGRTAADSCVGMKINHIILHIKKKGPGANTANMRQKPGLCVTKKLLTVSEKANGRARGPKKTNKPGQDRRRLSPATAVPTGDANRWAFGIRVRENAVRHRGRDRLNTHAEYVSRAKI